MRRPLSSESLEASAELMREISSKHHEYVVRDEQVEALASIYEDEAAGDDASLIVLATGLGKTLVVAAYALGRLREKPHERGLFLCDDTYVLNQSKATFDQIAGPEFTSGSFNGQIKEFDAFDLLFASFQVMHGGRGTTWRDAFHQDEFGFGIVDEGHRVKARTYEPTTRYFKFANLIGATATPDRHDTLDVRSIFGPESYSYPLEKAIARRRLATVDYYVIADELAETGLVLDDHDTEYYLGDFNHSIFAPRRDEEIVRLAKEYRKLIKADPVTLGFTVTKEHASRLAEIWGEEAAAYHSGVTPKARKRILDRYYDNELNALITVDMANQGFNRPEINQLLLMRGTFSKSLYLQQIGRGMRRTKTKKRLQILDFANNAERLLMADRLWAQIDGFREPREEGDETYEIDMSNVYFNESSRNALKVFRAISDQVYRPDQAVPEGAIRSLSLARDLNITTGVLRTVAGHLGIQPQIFPTQRGSQVGYYTSQDVTKIRNQLGIMFPDQS